MSSRLPERWERGVEAKYSSPVLASRQETLRCEAELCRKGPQFSPGIPISLMHPETGKRSSSYEGLGLLPQGEGNGGERASAMELSQDGIAFAVTCKGRARAVLIGTLSCTMAGTGSGLSVSSCQPM